MKCKRTKTKLNLSHLQTLDIKNMTLKELAAELNCSHHNILKGLQILKRKNKAGYGHKLSDETKAKFSAWMRVKENAFKENKTRVIEKCLTFLNN